MAGNASEPGRSVASKLASILLLFADGCDHSLTEIAGAARVPMSTAHRLSAEMVQRHLLYRADQGRYRIGMPLRTICLADGERGAVEDRGQHVLEDLASATGCRIKLGILAGDQVVFMQKLPGRVPIDGFDAEASMPAYSTALGRVLVAFSPPPVMNSMMHRAVSDAGRRRPISRQIFRRMLAITRANRMAINPTGMCCIAMPVFGPGGEPVASLGLTMRHLHQMEASICALRIASRSLSRELGYLPALHMPKLSAQAT